MIKSETPDASGRDSKLTEEILETQKARSDLLKWKFLVVATLGAAGLGLMEKLPALILVLALIPFACVYVDLLCSSLKLRLLVIGAYFASFHQSNYEGFVGKARQMFDLEDWALYWSTVCISFFVMLVGCWGYYTASKAPTDLTTLGLLYAVLRGENTEQNQGFQAILVGAAGLTGMVLSVFARRKANKRPALLQTQVPFGQVTYNHPEIARFQRAQYSAVELESLRQFLINKGAFSFVTLPNGLFPAAGSATAGDSSGYQNAWVRDNVHVAHAHYVCGDAPTATRTACALMAFFKSQTDRFEKTIKAGKAPLDPMERPHIRFDGGTLGLLDEKWSHAQNDALGYFLWFYCRLARDGAVTPGEPELKCLRLFPLYFDVIKFWDDRDSGHWEEPRKVNASSIGTVLAGLREFRDLWNKLSPVEKKEKDDESDSKSTAKLLDDLQEKGGKALARILPHECIEPPELYRRRDAALLFLIYPLEYFAATSPEGEMILEDVTSHLQGEYGIRRYVGDSYWCGDYTTKLKKEDLTRDYSESTKERDKFLLPGEEAQWCIFDSIISVIYGRRYSKLISLGDHRNAMESLRLQTYYLNRALGQLTGKTGKRDVVSAPESYYLKGGNYVPNDHTPLLWAQANLLLAMQEMRQQLKNDALK